MPMGLSTIQGIKSITSTQRVHEMHARMKSIFGFLSHLLILDVSRRTNLMKPNILNFD